MLAIHVSSIVVISREAFASSFAIIAAPWTFPALNEIAGSGMIFSVMALEVFLAQIALAGAVWRQTLIRSSLETNLWSANVNVRTSKR